MIFSYNCLNSFFDNKLPPVDEVKEKLILHSFEIEGVEKLGNDYAIDIDVLSNRAHDCYSHFGIARELAVVFDMPVNIPVPQINVNKNLNTSDLFEIQVQTNLTDRVTKRFVSNIQIKDSPNWLKNYLAIRGQKSINNVVDITNYVTFETGQPIHAFDYDKLVSNGDKKVMVLRQSKKGERLKLLDGKELDLDDVSLVWADSESVLDLAGIKGGMNSGVDETTKRIVISACHFDPVHIRKTRQNYKIITDASRHFEHGLSPELTLLGNERATQLIVELAEGSPSDVIDIYIKPQKQVYAKFKTNDVNRLIGTTLGDRDIESILNRFKRANFDWSKKGEDYVVAVPSERLDISELHEIVEEIARINGYYSITSSFSSTDDFKPRVYKPFYYNSLVKNILVDQGYSELYNYVMQDTGEIEIENPLSSDMQYLRTNMLDTLDVNLRLNFSNIDLLGKDQLKIFELNKVFGFNEEHWALGIGIKNSKSWKGGTEKETLVDLEKVMKQTLGTDIKWKEENRENGLVAELNLNDIVDKLKTPDSYGDVLSIQSDQVFKPFSKYPVVTRDIAFWMPNSASKEDISSLITKEAKELLVCMRLFDTFKKNDNVSYAYRLVFQSMSKTLLDSEINALMESIYIAFKDKGYEVR